MPFNLTAVLFIFCMITDTHQKNIASETFQNTGVLPLPYLVNGTPDRFVPFQFYYHDWHGKAFFGQIYYICIANAGGKFFNPQEFFYAADIGETDDTPQSLFIVVEQRGDSCIMGILYCCGNCLIIHAQCILQQLGGIQDKLCRFLVPSHGDCTYKLLPDFFIGNGNGFVG